MTYRITWYEPNQFDDVREVFATTDLIPRIIGLKVCFGEVLVFSFPEGTTRIEIEPLI
jgi:hypothetical protein